MSHALIDTLEKRQIKGSDLRITLLLIALSGFVGRAFAGHDEIDAARGLDSR